MVRLTAVGIRFQICGAAEEKARRPKLVFMLGTCVSLYIYRNA